MPVRDRRETPRRILMTADTVGGVWTFALELAQALVPYEIEVCLATLGGLPSDAQRRRAQRVPGLRLFESAYRLEWMDDPWTDVVAAADWLLDLRHRLDPDVVHLNHFGHGDLPWNAPVVLSAHSCVTSWWQAVHGCDPPASWQRYRGVVRRAIHAAHVVTAPTATMLDAVAVNYGEPRLGRIVPNGREPRGYYQRPKEPFILAAGRLWDEAKNVAALDRIAGRLPWPVYVAGEARHPSGGVAPLGASHPLGRLSDRELADWFARAAIYALPARYEPFGLSVLEAALSGCALVLGDISSLRENWHGQALFVDPDDDERLHAALADLVTDAPRRALLGERARRRARAFLPETMAAAYVEAYQEAAEEHQRARAARVREVS